MRVEDKVLAAVTKLRSSGRSCTTKRITRQLARKVDLTSKTPPSATNAKQLAAETETLTRSHETTVRAAITKLVRLGQLRERGGEWEIPPPPSPRTSVAAF